jgi:hypothetical protein
MCHALQCRTGKSQPIERDNGWHGCGTVRRMPLRTSLGAWTTAFLATLGLAPLFVACAGTTLEHPGSGPQCRNRTARVGPDGNATGLFDCEGGSTVRVESTECGSALPRSGQCSTTLPGGQCDPALGNCGCTTDADCTERPNGYCGSGGQVYGCYCSYGCRKDSDCGSGMLCLCGDPVGSCISSTCTAKSDCAGSSECLSYVQNPGCPGVAFACQAATDTCASDADCTGGAQCSLEGSARHCKPMNCAVGRPFLVGGAALVANAVRREDWTSGLVPNLDGLDAGAREKLAVHWRDIALMEHASIAAFARFTLEALSVGAPPDFVNLAQAAMADETAHARDAFALASAYAGATIGPGALATENALGGRSLLDILETTILEGCIGETVAAVEAAEALAHATDPAVREALTLVTADETRHAELAWRFVRWALESGDEAFSRAVTSLLARTAMIEASFDEDAPATDEPDEKALREHGMLTVRARHEIRRRVLREIVLPCARGLTVGSAGRLAA